MIRDALGIALLAALLWLGGWVVQQADVDGAVWAWESK